MTSDVSLCVRLNDVPREHSNYIVEPGYRYSRIPGITIMGKFLKISLYRDKAEYYLFIARYLINL